MRASSAKNAALITDLIGSAEFVSDILPLIANLAQDTAPNVRSTSVVLKASRLVNTK